jgi:signal transduction histidine kinase
MSVMREELESRYRAVLEAALAEGGEYYLAAARDLGREFFVSSLNPADILQIHLNALQELFVHKGGKVRGAGPRCSLLVLGEVLAGWAEEWEVTHAQLRISLEIAEKSVVTARQAAQNRVAQLIRGNHVLVQEISRRRRAEQRLRRTKLWLLRAQRLARIGFWLWRLPEGRFHLRGLWHFVHKSGTIQRTLSKVDDFIAWVHPEDRPVVERSFEQIRQGRNPGQLEYRLLNQESIYVQQDVAILQTPGKHRWQALGVVVDITRIKLAEAVIRRTERGAALGVFAAGLAHEINNPLGSALLCAETALSLLGDPTKQNTIRQCLETIAESLKRCSQIVQGILAFSRRQPGERTLCNLNEIVCRSAQAAQVFLERRQATLQLSADQTPIWIQASPVEIELALVNFLRNAIESREFGTRVWVRTGKHGPYAVVTIQDNGRGMSASEVEHLFDPFYTTRASEGGAGLGASLAQAIIQDYGGRVYVRSEIGLGTTLEVYLPAAECPDSCSTASNKGVGVDANGPSS